MYLYMPPQVACIVLQNTLFSPGMSDLRVSGRNAISRRCCWGGAFTTAGPNFVNDLYLLIHLIGRREIG